jgi:hypothetical protein
MAKQQYTSDGGGVQFSMASLRLIGLGFIAVLAFVFVFNYTRSNEYPKLLHGDSLNYIVQSVDKDRSAAFVTFESGKKYQMPWAKNFKYEEFPSLSDVISNGDLITKKPFSDTVTVSHLGKEYVYVLKQTIEK